MEALKNAAEAAVNESDAGGLLSGLLDGKTEIKLTLAEEDSPRVRIIKKAIADLESGEFVVRHGYYYAMRLIHLHSTRGPPAAVPSLACTMLASSLSLSPTTIMAEAPAKSESIKPWLGLSPRASYARWSVITRVAKTTMFVDLAPTCATASRRCSDAIC